MLAQLIRLFINTQIQVL